MGLFEERQTIRYEQISNQSEQEVKQKIAEVFPDGATLYAVLDYAVCFGVYEKKCFTVGLGRKPESIELEWQYLQELRVFNSNKEIFLTTSENGWSGRIRRDIPNGIDDKKASEYTIDECQKLWGEVKVSKEIVRKGWCLLNSERGSNIQIPVAVDKTGVEEGILIRRYMRIPDVEKDLELVFQNDIRMVEFCPWGEGDDGYGD